MIRILPEGVSYEPGAARYVLTMRYNPLLEPGLPIISPSDMRPARASSPSPDAIEDLAVDAMSSVFDKTPDARVAVSLSGGVDSTMVLGLLHRHFPDLDVTAISVRFGDGNDETGAAARTAEHLGVKHVIVDVDDYMGDLPAAIHTASQPMWDLHWYHVARRAAAESADILVSGDGGDELFGGYTFRYQKFLAAASGVPDSPDQRVRAYLGCHLRDHVPDQEKVFGPRMKFSWSDIWRVLRPHFDNGLEPLEQVFLADYNGKLLYNFSHVSRAMSRRFGIRTVSPLLSNGMVRHAMCIRAGEKYDSASGVGKLPLRALLGSMGLRHLVSGSKMGFSPDTVSYWRRYGYDVCSAYLGDAASRTVSDGWISRDWIRRNLSRDVRDVRCVNKLLGLLAFEVWYRIFVTRDMDPEAGLA